MVTAAAVSSKLDELSRYHHSICSRTFVFISLACLAWSLTQSYLLTMELSRCSAHIMQYSSTDRRGTARSEHYLTKTYDELSDREQPARGPRYDGNPSPRARRAHTHGNCLGLSRYRLCTNPMVAARYRQHVLCCLASSTELCVARSRDPARTSAARSISCTRPTTRS